MIGPTPVALNPYCNQNYLTPVQTKILSCQQAKCEGFFWRKRDNFRTLNADLLCIFSFLSAYRMLFKVGQNLFFFRYSDSDCRAWHFWYYTMALLCKMITQNHSVYLCIYETDSSMSFKYTRMNLFYQTALVCRFWQPRTKLLFRKFFFSFFSRILTTNNSV
jgi:hypothetical protein